MFPDALPAVVVPALLAGGGLVVVLVAALAFRLHALIALTLAGLAVMWLTPAENIVRAEVEPTAERFAVRDVGEQAGGMWGLGVGGSFSPGLEPSLTAYRPGPGGGLGEPVASLRLDQATDWDWKFPRAIDGDTLVRTGYGDYLVTPPDTPAWGNTIGSGRVAAGPFWPTVPTAGTPGLLKPGDLLVSSREGANASAVAALDPPARFAAAFGETAGEIGLLIAFASVLGAGLLRSGAAERLVRALLSVVGPRGRPAAFCAGGFVLGVPVFFDAVFLLCAPLAKSAALKGDGEGEEDGREARGGGYLLLLLAICCGGTMTHSLVPPTPGPLLVAAELNVSIPLMIAAGTGVGAIAAAIGLLWAVWHCRRRARAGKDVPVREGGGTDLARLRELGARPLAELPPLWLSLLPVAIPIFLIAQRAGWEAAEPWRDRVSPAVVTLGPSPPPTAPLLAVSTPGWEIPAKIVHHLGEPTTAVLLGTLISLFLLWRWAGPGERRGATAAAVAEGGGILLVAAAGGAFGGALRQTGVGSLIAAIPDLGGVGLLVTAWAVAAAMRTAQGSATVAMVVAAGVVAAAIPGSGVHAVWVACAIGCGSKALAWMNASGFWVVCRAGGLAEREALSAFTPLTGVLALAGLAATLAGAWLWPGA